MKALLSAMNEISEREDYPDRLVYCKNCKTKTVSIDGECWFCYKEVAE